MCLEYYRTFSKYALERLSLKHEIVLKGVLTVELELILNGLKSYSGRKPLDFEVQKSYFTNGTATDDLADGTT